MSRCAGSCSWHPVLILRRFGVRKVSQKVWIRIHHFRIVFTFLTDRCAFGDVVFLVRLIKIAWKINRNVDFPGFSKSFIRLSANPHRKLRHRYQIPKRLRSFHTIHWLFVSLTACTAAYHFSVQLIFRQRFPAAPACMVSVVIF